MQPQTIRPPAYAQVRLVSTVSRTAPHQMKVTVPSISIIKNPPFKPANSSKPLTCRNEASLRPRPSRLPLSLPEVCPQRRPVLSEATF